MNSSGPGSAAPARWSMPRTVPGAVSSDRHAVRLWNLCPSPYSLVSACSLAFRIGQQVTVCWGDDPCRGSLSHKLPGSPAWGPDQQKTRVIKNDTQINRKTFPFTDSKIQILDFKSEINLIASTKSSSKHRFPYYCYGKPIPYID